MLDRISRRITDAWQKWNIRGVILFSLLLQTFLVFFAPSRKFTRSNLVIGLIWCAFLLADSVASFSVGQISTTFALQRLAERAPAPGPARASAPSHPATPRTAALDGNLMAFWAPFVLLHSGSPDSITAFSLEDGTLWRRHYFTMISIILSVLIVLAQSLTSNTVLVPTVLVLLAGIIKYSERIWALYKSSLDNLKNSLLEESNPGPDYAKFMEEYASKIDSNLPTSITCTSETSKNFKSSAVAEREGRLDESEVIQYAFYFSNIFKGLLVDSIFSFHELEESRAFFIGTGQEGGLEAEDALRVIEVELNFIYDICYTKFEAVQSAWAYFLRISAFALIVAALVHFHFVAKKDTFDHLSKAITYALLLGAVALEVAAFCVLFFSDWTFALLQKLRSASKLQSSSIRVQFKLLLAAIVIRFLSFKKSCWHFYNQKVNLDNTELDVGWNVMLTPFLLGRWSGSVPTYNLIGCCLRSSPKKTLPLKSCLRILLDKIIACLCLEQAFHFIASIVSVVIKPSSCLTGATKLKHCLKSFTTLAEKIVQKIGAEEFVNQMLYVSCEPFTKELWEFIFKELKEKSQDADDSEIAGRIYSARGDWVLTDTQFPGDHSHLMPYVTDVPYDESVLLWHIATEICYNTDTDQHVTTQENLQNKYRYCKFSKLLSDYMLYLLATQESKMMSAVSGIVKIRIRDTCAEAKIFFERRDVGPNQMREACEEIISVNTCIEPSAVKGDKSKTALFEASRLAKELKALEVKEGGERMWKLVSNVWVELLAYAASHCGASTHAQQLTQGGELVTFVWLLMAHFGIGKQVQINVGRKRAKFIVQK